MLLADTEVKHIGWGVYGSLGLAAFILIVLLIALLPPMAKRLARGSVLLWLAHFPLLGLHALLEEETSTHFLLQPMALFTVLASIARSLFLLVTESRLNRFVTRMPKIFLDIVHGCGYVAALLITLRASGVHLDSLVAGSALVTAVLGLSLRDTFNNLFAGLAIQAQRPFEVGDWIQLDKEGNMIGRVVEINWRATKVETPESIEILFPNGSLNQNPILNFSKPEAHSRRSVLVYAPYDVPPQRVHQVLLEAVTEVPGALDSPAPAVITKDFTDRGILYAVWFSVADFKTKGRVESRVRDRVWYAFRRHGIAMPIPGRDLHMHPAVSHDGHRQDEGRAAQKQQALRCVDFFERLPEEALRHLAEHSEFRLYAEQEVIIRQGDPGEELFIMEQGEVSVNVALPGKSAIEVDRMGPQNFFGEMSLLTGQPRTATVRAECECELLVVNKAALARVLSEVPKVAEQITEVISRRRANATSKVAQHAQAETPRESKSNSMLLKHIKDFFSI